MRWLQEVKEVGKSARCFRKETPGFLLFFLTLTSLFLIRNQALDLVSGARIMVFTLISEAKSNRFAIDRSIVRRTI